MQNIKNFKPALPFVEDAKKLGDAVNTTLFLMSEDNQDWYECQKLFSEDTIKIMYDENGVIRSVVDKPIRERGNTYAVSMFFPLNMSVAEVASLPDGFTLDGTWKFDGVAVYQCAEALSEKTYQQNQRMQRSLLTTTCVHAFAIQSSAAIGHPRDGDSDKLLALQHYADALRDVDLAHPVWPEPPAYI